MKHERKIKVLGPMHEDASEMQDYINLLVDMISTETKQPGLLRGEWTITLQFEDE